MAKKRKKARNNDKANYPRLHRQSKGGDEMTHKCEDDCPFCLPKIEKHSLDISKYNQLEIHITKYTKLNIDHRKHKLTLSIEPDENGMGVITHTGGGE